ncbi:MAG TPA: hypothetical protein VE397_03180 [Stellaceae bacterium]|jgi:hypothetical protein|nr:hypothetical protein [Stellaceae bacterium]
MYRSLSLSLLLVALGAAPAVAAGGSGGHVSLGFHSGHVSGFHGSHFFAFNSGQFGQPFRSRQSRFFAPFAWGWGDWADWDGGPAGGAPGSVVVLAMAPPAPPAPARSRMEARPSVENTEAGVTIVRGPGSHHSAQ